MKISQRIQLAKKPVPTLQSRALGLLRKLASSPASIFVPGSGYLQALDNKLTYSRDFTQGSVWPTTPTNWSASASDVLSPIGDYSGAKLTAGVGATTLTRSYTATGTTQCFYLIYKTGTHTAPSFLVRNQTNTTNLVDNSGVQSGSGSNAYGTWEIIDQPNGWKLCRITCTSGITVGNSLLLYFGSAGSGIDGKSFYLWAAGLSDTHYTAQQIASLGIPWTMATASVSLSLGPELVTNGAGDSLSGWTNPSGNWAVSAGRFVNVAGSGSIEQTILSVGKAYYFSFEQVGSLANTLNVFVGSTNFTQYTIGSQAGYKSLATTASGDGRFIFQANGANTVIDNLSCREILSVSCPVYTDAHVYLPGSTVTSYGAELVTTQFTSLTGYTNQTRCSLAIVGDEVELTATATGVCFVDVPSVAIVVGSTYQVSVLARYSGIAGGVVYLGAAMASVPFSSLTTSATSVPLSLTPVADYTVLSLRMRLDATAIGQKAYFKLGSVREVITSSSVTSGLLSNNYTLSDGSTGYSAVDGTAGLVLDGAGSVGAEQVVNGGFDVDANWTKGAGWSITGGAAVASGATANLTQSGVAPAPVGKTYKVSLAITAFTSGSIVPQIGGSTVTLNAAGNYTFYLTPTLNDATLYIATGGFTGTIDNVSVMQVTGIHATQSTTANKPALRRGLYNLLTYSQDFTQAVWTKSNVTPSGSIVTTTATNHTLRNQYSVTPGQTYTIGIKAKRGTMTDAKVGAYDAIGASTILSSSYYAEINSSDYAIVARTITAPAGCTNLYVYALLDSGITGTIDIAGVGLFQGTLTAAQILAEGGIPLTTSTAASNPSAGRYWRQFDGTNDSLYATTAPFNQNDDWFMCSAFRVDDVSGYRVIQHATIDNTSKGAKLMVGQTNGYPALEMYDGTTWVSIADPVSCVGQVVVMWATQVAGVRKLWKNGVLIGTDNTALAPIASVGYRIGGGTVPGGSFFNGMLGPQMAHKGTFSDADALTLARMVASNTPNAPVF